MSLSAGAVHAREVTSSGVWKLIQVTPSVQGGVVKLPLLRGTWFRHGSILGLALECRASTGFTASKQSPLAVSAKQVSHVWAAGPLGSGSGRTSMSRMSGP